MEEADKNSANAVSLVNSVNGQKVDTDGDRHKIQGTEIVYGKGGARLLLGDTDDQAIGILGSPHSHYVYEGECNVSESIWIDEKDEGNGVTAYFRDGAIVQLKIADSRIKTEEGITFGTSAKRLNELYARYGKFKEFSLRITDGDFAPDYPRYLVDRENGVAFKINHRRGEKNDAVWAIEIFPPDTDFQPNGCVRDKSLFVQGN
jgi:hypothetical protein